MASDLFAGVMSRGRVAAEVGDAAWLRALLDVEAALARAGAVAGLVPADAAQAVTSACSDPSAFDAVTLGSAPTAAGNPVVPLVRRIEELAGPDAGAHVHRGATSQDVLDTAMMLVACRALAVLRDDLHAAALAAEGLAQRHRVDPIAGRTLLQAALPTTFGLKAAGWLSGLDAADDRLAVVSDRLPVSMFGAVGTFSAAGGAGGRLLEALAAELDLPVPAVAWHTLRLPVADLAGALGTTAGVVAKVALDIVLLAQTEVGEVAEGAPDRGGSSTMPHKNNPVAAVAARAAALRAPGLVATLLTVMAQEHERAAGAWHAEWEALSDLLRVTGSAVAWLGECLGSLRVDPERMLANLDRTAAVSAAEAVAGALAPALGRSRAHRAVAGAVRRAQQEGRERQKVIADDADVAPHLDGIDLAALLAPNPGEAADLVDRALAASRARRE
jgi:3-carboxy-cis,cis-muconate cycloisomerase